MKLRKYTWRPSRRQEIHVAIKAELADPEIQRSIVNALKRYAAAGGRLNLR